MPVRPFGDDDVNVATLATTAFPSATRTDHAVRVHVVAGPDAGLGGALAGPRAMIGRGAGADLRLRDPAVSSFHVEIGPDGAGIAVRDLESTNGTFYAGARVAAAVVPSGASIAIGATVLRLDLDAPRSVAAPELASFGELRGASRAMRELFGLLARLARTELAVLVEGPTGTGKELVARGLHDQSLHARGPFVVLDCAALPAGIAESILFGHERGAFTGAAERRAGVFEEAGEGTVFLDEIGELPMDLQPKLLRVLERREVTRLGSATPKPVRARVVSATWRDLRARVNQGAFREDLYYRLTQARAVLPSLRDRREDVPVLVRHFLERMPPGAPGARAMADDALAELVRRDYPGNVRELKNTVERASALAAGDVVTAADLAFERMLMGDCARAAEPAAFAWPGGGDEAALPPFKDAKHTLVHDFERQYLERLLARTGDNLSRASALARIERHHLRDLLRKHGLRGED
jgi:DNA-binding NtrC family response regulator